MHVVAQNRGGICNKFNLSRIILCIGCAAGLTLVGCQNNVQPLPTEDRYHLGLGAAQQTNPLASEDTLKKVLQDYQNDDNQLGIARANWSLGELLKSPNYQANIKPPQTIKAYLTSADYFQTSATTYQAINKPSMASNAYIGAANAYLLADKLDKACQSFKQAQTINSNADAATDKLAHDNLQRNLRFFSNLVAACKSVP